MKFEKNLESEFFRLEEVDGRNYSVYKQKVLYVEIEDNLLKFLSGEITAKYAIKEMAYFAHSDDSTEDFVLEWEDYEKRYRKIRR